MARSYAEDLESGKYYLVTDAGLKDLAGLKSLKILTLSRPLVTDAGVKELRKALPSCVIELYDANPVRGCGAKPNKSFNLTGRAILVHKS